MTDLSPAAQAVKDAAFHGVSHDTAHTLEARIAASLRAAVEQCAMKREIHPDSLLTESIIDADDLLAIAQELENHQ